jgi:hypothetical protein
MTKRSWKVTQYRVQPDGVYFEEREIIVRAWTRKGARSQAALLPGGIWDGITRVERLA